MSSRARVSSLLSSLSSISASLIAPPSELNDVLYPFAVAKIAAPVLVLPYYNAPPLSPVPPPPKDLGAAASRGLLPDNGALLPSPLLKCLIDCVRLTNSNPDLAAKSPARTKESTSKVGNSTQWVASFFAEALHCRLVGPQSAPGPRQCINPLFIAAVVAWADEEVRRATTGREGGQSVVIGVWERPGFKDRESLRGEHGGQRGGGWRGLWRGGSGGLGGGRGGARGPEARGSDL